MSASSGETPAIFDCVVIVQALTELAMDRSHSQLRGVRARQRCEESVRMNSIVLDAARAIEGLESVEALERLQGRSGLPDSETLLRVRVVGVTPRLL